MSNYFLDTQYFFVPTFFLFALLFFPSRVLDFSSRKVCSGPERGSEGTVNRCFWNTGVCLKYWGTDIINVKGQEDQWVDIQGDFFSTKGSRKKISFFLSGLATRGRLGGKGRATKKKYFFFILFLTKKSSDGYYKLEGGGWEVKP